MFSFLRLILFLSRSSYSCERRQLKDLGYILQQYSSRSILRFLDALKNIYTYILAGSMKVSPIQSFI